MHDVYYNWKADSFSFLFPTRRFLLSSENVTWTLLRFNGTDLHANLILHGVKTLQHKL